MSTTANRAYHCGVEGYYVVNPQTDIAVARFATERAAWTDAQRRDLQYAHIDPNKLTVVAVFDGARL